MISTKNMTGRLEGQQLARHTAPLEMAHVLQIVAAQGSLHINKPYGIILKRGKILDQISTRTQS